MPIRFLLASCLLVFFTAYAAAVDFPCWDKGACTGFFMKNPKNGLYDQVYQCKPQMSLRDVRGNPNPPVLVANKLDPADSPQRPPSYRAGTLNKYRVTFQKCGGIFFKSGAWGDLTYTPVPNPYYIDPSTGLPETGQPATIPPPCGYYFVTGDCTLE